MIKILFVVSNGGNRIIPGSSSISFDEVSKKRIYDSIDNASFSRISLFKKNIKS